MHDFTFAPETTEALAGKLVTPCLVCQLPGRVFNITAPGTYKPFEIFCSRCGPYKVFQEGTLNSKLADLSSAQVANASGYLRENSPFVIKDEMDIDFLTQLATPSVAAKSHKLLAQMAKLCPIPGTQISIKVNGLDSQINHFKRVLRENPRQYSPDATADKAALETFPWLSFAWAQNQTELNFLITSYLVHGVGFLEPWGSASSLNSYMITSKGWEHLQAQGISDSTTGFVAMWFDPAVTTVWEQAIYPAIKEAGYSPLRIDKKQHNNKIDDEIIASIRGAKFVIADFTGHRGGVYYEAGFAGGLGKPVIWTVRDDDLIGAHFDTRQFNHILWNEKKLSQFKEDLKQRILATLGQGPVK